MVGRTPDAITRWLLVCALAFAVVAMHHLTATIHGSASPTVATTAHHGGGAPGAVASDHCCADDPDHQPTGDHDLLHLCTAILMGLLVLITALVVWRRHRVSRGRAPPRRAVATPAPPSPVLPGGRATLHSVCVLRL